MKIGVKIKSDEILKILLAAEEMKAAKSQGTTLYSLKWLTGKEVANLSNNLANSFVANIALSTNDNSNNSDIDSNVNEPIAERESQNHF